MEIDQSHLCMLFWSGKQEATYEEMLRDILNRMLQLNVMLQVQAFSMVFEIAAHNAALTVFLNRSNGCFYNLTQSIWRKIQELGLAGRYNMDPPFKNFCGQLDSLAFLPLNDVQLGMNTIRNIALISNEPIDILRLLDYFDKNLLEWTG